MYRTRAILLFLGLGTKDRLVCRKCGVWTWQNSRGNTCCRCNTAPRGWVR